MWYGEKDVLFSYQLVQYLTSVLGKQMLTSHITASSVSYDFRLLIALNTQLFDKFKESCNSVIYLAILMILEVFTHYSFLCSLITAFCVLSRTFTVVLFALFWQLKISNILSYADLSYAFLVKCLFKYFVLLLSHRSPVCKFGCMCFVRYIFCNSFLPVYGLSFFTEFCFMTWASWCLFIMFTWYPHKLQISVFH